MPKFLVTISLIICSTLFLAQNKDGLVAKYTFNNGTAEDELKRNNAKAYGLSLTEDRFGNSNMAYYFHGGPESFLNLGTSKLLKPEKGTLSIWVNIHGLMGLGKGVEINPIMVTRSDTGDDCNQAYYLGVDVNSRKLNGSITNSCMHAATIYSWNEITFVKWYHLALTFDDSTLKFYLDGKLQYKTGKKFKNRYDANDSVLVGKMWGAKNVRYFLGCMDDIAIYNRVLNDKEIQELYNEPNPKKYKEFLKWIAIGLILLAFLYVVVLLIRYRVRVLVNREKEKNILQNHWYEQENRVLTAQMDPHFIFNSLNTIQQFIIINDHAKAQLYLSKFSRLMRKILENNTKKSVSLKDEIEVFEKYLEIESLRFNNVFNYKIEIKGDLKPQEVSIPHFLIQPVIENAIWHGLLPKDGEKELVITFEIQDKETLLCTVDDNGVGRKHSRQDEKKYQKTSLAINFIQQRLQLLSKMKNRHFGIDITDKVDVQGRSEGTKVTLKIPILNNTK